MKRCIALLLAGCLLSSCATMTRGRDEVIAVESNPSGATATIKCAGNVSASGQTPARLTIPRKADLCRVDVEKSGMAAQKIQIERGFNASYWMNFSRHLVCRSTCCPAGPLVGTARLPSVG